MSIQNPNRGARLTDPRNLPSFAILFCSVRFDIVVKYYTIIKY